MLLQREPVIRDLQFHLLRGRRQLVGTKEHDPASKNQDNDADKGEKWLAHLLIFNRLTITRDTLARMAFRTGAGSFSPCHSAGFEC